jgi:hypothetical protein
MPPQLDEDLIQSEKNPFYKSYIKTDNDQLSN